VWLESAKNKYGDSLQINWRGFPLEQVNSKEGSDWKIWDQPDDYPFRGFPALKAGEAARRQGVEGFDRFHIALLRARHEDRKNIADVEVLLEIARNSNLDSARFREDIGDPLITKKIVDDYTEAVEQHGVFGTPTFLFPNGASAFLKMVRPPEEEAPDLLRLLSELIGKWTYVGEVKRPQPPWPKGLISNRG